MTPAQGAARDRCQLGSVLRDGEVINWCLTHDQPAAHDRPQVGDVGADPADRALPSDAEEQYAGRIAGTTRRTTRRDQLVRAAVATLRTAPVGLTRDAATMTLARLRGEQWTAALGDTHRPQVIPLIARCENCQGDLQRDLAADDTEAVLYPWWHTDDDGLLIEADHPARPVFG